MWERLQRLARARLVKGKARVNRSKARVPGVFWATSHRATARCGNGSSVIGTRRRGPLRERRQVLPGHEKRRQVGLKVARHLPAKSARPSPGPARAAPQPTAPPHRQPHRSSRACWGPPTHGAPPRLHRGTGAGRGGPVLRRVGPACLPHDDQLLARRTVRTAGTARRAEHPRHEVLDDRGREPAHQDGAQRLAQPRSCSAADDGIRRNAPFRRRRSTTPPPSATGAVVVAVIRDAGLSRKI